MTELQAEQGAPALDVPRTEAKPRRNRDVVIALAVFVVLALLPMVFSSKLLLDFVIRCAAYGLFATSLNLLVGYTGLTSFGHGMFFGLGAYGFGLIMQRTGLPVPVAFVATLVITTLIAAVIGAICVRLKEIYFAFVTLAIPDADPQHDPVLGVADGGDQGCAAAFRARAFFGIDLSNHVHLLHSSSCALLVTGLCLMRQIAQSPFGYTLRMNRDNATRASFIGIDVWRAKLTIFVLAALFASTGGIIMALFVSGRLSRIRLLDHFGRGHLHQHARRRDHIPGANGRHRTAPDPQRYRYPFDRISRHRARDRDPVLRHRPAEGPDGFRRRMVRATPRRHRGAQLAMLEIRSLSKAFGGVKATDNVTLDFADGSLTAVIGPNGAGKSTFFNLITGALRPDSGQILLNGVDMAGRSPPEIVRYGIGRAFQVASIFPSLTVEETMLAAVCADQRRASVLHRRFPLAETRDRAEHAMELLGLAGKRNRIAATLSHGDQKLLDIALALVLDPKVLLLDEPTAGMGTEERWRMIDKVRELWEKQKITVVFIEHDMDIVFKIAPEIVVLCYGRILATGTPDAIRRNEAVIEAYLGTEHHAGAAI
jgi:branched-chain amino acid transport system ATP-binding protein